MEKPEQTINLSLNRRQAIVALILVSIGIIAAVVYFTGLYTKAYEYLYWADANITIVGNSPTKKTLSATIGLKNTDNPKYNQQSTTKSSDGLASFSNLIRGAYQITITKDGYITKTENITLTKGHNILRYSLDTVPPTKVDVTGVVQNYISEQPISNVEISLGDRRLNTDANGKFLFSKVPSGKITISINQSGFLPFTTQATIAKGNSTIERINLIPAGTVVFSSNRDKGKQGLFVSNYDGTGQVPLIKRIGDYEDFNPTQSPDKKKIVFLSTRDGKKDSNSNLVRALYVVDLDGKNLTKVADAADYLIKWTKDSKKFLWIHYNNDISDYFVYDIATKKNYQIEAGNNIQSLDINDAATKLIYKIQNKTTYNYDIHVSNIDGSQSQVAISDLPTTSSIYRFLDNNKFLYTTYQNNSTKYFTYNIPTKENKEIQYDTTKRENIANSPNGKLYAFIDNRDGKRNVFIANPDGTNEKKLTAIDTAQGLLGWSLDGKLLFFTSSKTGESALYVVSIEGGTAKKIVDTSEYYGMT